MNETPEIVFPPWSFAYSRRLGVFVGVKWFFWDAQNVFWWRWDRTNLRGCVLGFLFIIGKFETQL